MRPTSFIAAAIAPLLLTSFILNPIANAAPGQPYPRRPYLLVDQVKPGSSFFQFREELRQAIRDRNADWIRAIADPNIRLGFGRPQPLSSLDIDNPNAPFWKNLERVLSTGCAPYEAPPGATSESWACPHAYQAAAGNPFADVYIVGTGVNVRAEPRLDSPVVDGVSNELVKVDESAFNRLSAKQRAAIETLEGWYPIITPTGNRGYVSSRYAFLPAGYRVMFERRGNSWKMTAFVNGD